MTITWRGHLVLFALVALALSRAPMAQTAAIKLATVVPDGSIWDKAIKQIGPTGRKPPTAAFL